MATLVALAVAALAWVLVAALRRRRSRQDVAADTSAPAASSAPADTVRDAEAWRTELERLLSQGAGEWSAERTGAALRAAWWWLARAIAGPEAAADWTSRDLAARARGRELRDVLRRLDVLTFGAGRPGWADLRGLAEQIRLSLGGPLG